MRHRRRFLLSLAFLALGPGVAACGRPEPVSIDEFPCPPGGTALTWESFGESFLASNCQSCHGAPLGQRQGAKVEHDFGTHDAAQRHRERIFANAAATNTYMPPGPDDPPLERRMQLAEWLACGAP